MSTDVVGRRTWFSIVDEHARRRGTKIAINFDGVERLTYGDLAAATRAVAASLADRGVSRGAVIGLVSGTCIEFPIAVMAAHRLGAVVVPVSTRLRREEIEHQLGHCGASVVIADNDNALVGREWAARTRARYLGAAPDAARSGEDSIRSLMSGSGKLDDVDVVPDDLATIMYTSGSTGHPKGVMLTHGNYVYNSEVLKRLYGYSPLDVGLSFFPLCHQNGHNYQLATWLTAGSEVVLLPRFSASRFAEQVAHFGATITGLISTHVKMILAQEPTRHDRDHRLRMVKYAMDLDLERFRAFEERFRVELQGSYSQTELIAPVTFNPPEGLRKVDSIGIPVLGVALRVVDQSGKDLPPGESGEMLVRPASRHAICGGYLGENQPLDNLGDDGWWRTLDLGRFDEDGYLYFTGRVKDMIKRGGFNVAAAEVERVLNMHVGIHEAAVIGVPDDMREEAVKALVIPAGHRDLGADEVRQFCAERLAAYKVPELIEFVVELPRTDAGKIDKRACRELYGAAATSEPTRTSASANESIAH